MKCALHRCIKVLAALAFAPGVAVAQIPVHSFADLQPLLKTGQRVVVTSTDGARSRGTVVSLAGSQLAIRRFRAFRRAEPRSFAESSVRLIESDDSDWNGLLIGAGAGALAIVGALKLPACNHADDLSCLWIVDASVPIGALTGAAIDRARRRSLYISPQPTP